MYVYMYACMYVCIYLAIYLSMITQGFGWLFFLAFLLSLPGTAKSPN